MKNFEYPKDFNPEEKFEHAFGIITDGTKPEKIKLWFSNAQADYIKASPYYINPKVASENESRMYNGAVLESYPHGTTFHW
jgi:hypothetical protein